MSTKVNRCEFVHGLKCEDVSRRITELEGKVAFLREQLHTELEHEGFLNDENDRLREHIECKDHLANVARLIDENSKLRRENANLRELVMQYHSAMRCYLETGLWLTDPKCLEATMREPGIEVDE